MGAGIGKLMILIGIIFIVLGGIFWLAPNIPFLGKLPGDIDYKSGNFRFYFPVVTCIILSILLTILLNLFGGWK